MARHRNPRRGSMGYYPRKRARSIVARVRSWASIEKAIPLGFAGYKVGTLHVVKVEDNPHSPFYGQEIVKAATVIETPPLYVVAARLYGQTAYGLRTLTEVWSSSIPRDLERVLTLPERLPVEEQMAKVEKVKSSVSEVRLLVATQPRVAGIRKKTPEVFEIKVGGGPAEALSYALGVVGKELGVSDVFKAGDSIDVIAVTKGKGFQGVVKRFGVKELPRWHKHRKGSRRIGAVGPQKPAIMFTTPFAGQTGFHQRTEYNKRILKIGDASKSDDINPPGGWPHYGLVRGPYVIVEGTVPGPAKRLVRMRFSIRPARVSGEEPRVVYVSSRPVEGR